ncbi:MAG TPA: DNA-processing protein DprA [Candidatus Rifleibacterium sp.]|nr:DNA-processing protein DprA [Candidatus Rifleibacterium sp.]HPT46651.1 DNA-processing protein DprA [Candidatus Rifleibacterium sp.]
MVDADLRLPWLKLASLNWLGATLAAGLIKEFETPQRAFRASRGELMRIKGWDFHRAERFVAEATTAEPVCPPELLDRKEIRLVCFNDADYPPLLREIPDSPTVLFVKGDLNFAGAPAIAVVGARNGTQMGYDIARDFACRLARAGFIIVSGMALGIDTYAHRGALEADGRTIAVLANGPDVVYPRGNQKIRDGVLKRGAIVSEYAPGVIARPWFFPIRNRVISGMCVATLVVEASARSGSLITARLAGEQNREVFAIPGSVRSKVSEGTLSLISDGANLVTDPDEIIEYFSALLPEAEGKESELPADDLSADEKKLLSQIDCEPVSLDRLLEMGWQRERLFSLLLQLEMRDYVIKLTGNTYQAKMKVTEKGRL